MRKEGWTLVELLIVLAILGILATVGIYNGQRILKGQEGAAFIRTLQGVFWQGATEAASRGEPLSLDRSGNQLRLLQGGRVLRTWDIPKGVSLGVGDGPLATFTPPGKIQDQQGKELRSPMEIPFTVGERNYKARVSLIGEVKVVEAP